MPNRHDRVVAADPQAPAGGRDHLPPRRGLPLGLRLGLAVALTVALVLGGTTSLQQRRETRREWRDREQLLAESLAPLARDLETAAGVDEMRFALETFQQAYVWRGHPDHQVRLLDADGRVVAASQADPGPADPAPMRAAVEVLSPLLEGGRGTLEVWQDASQFRAEARERWRLWWVNIAVTALTIVATVQLAIFLLISRPLGALVGGLRRLEMGYMGEVDLPRGAWEVHWLAARMERTTRELRDTVLRLVAAERRALEPSRPADRAPAPRPGVGEGQAPVAAVGAGDDDGGDGEGRLRRQYLEDTCRLLESLPEDDPVVRAVAVEAWEATAFEAGRLGAMDLKARLEDAALRVLDPATFEGLRVRLAASRAARRDWVRARRLELEQALAAAGAPHLEIQHRVKHLAGVWRKMQQKQLELEQVHDLHAFRVVVPEEADCYLALGAVHRAFEAEPFRFKDYIASPKDNGYQGLHTSVRDRDGQVFEVQIRSLAMHRAAEQGAAAHWRYKVEAADDGPRVGRVARVVRGLGRVVAARRRRPNAGPP